MEGGGHMDALLPHPWVPSGSQRMSCKRGTGLSSPSWAASPPRLSPKIPSVLSPQSCSNMAMDCRTPVHPVSTHLGSAAAFSQPRHPLFAPTLLFQGFYFLGGNYE